MRIFPLSKAWIKVNVRDIHIDFLALSFLWSIEVLLLGVRLEDAGRSNVPLQFLGSALLYVPLFWRRQQPLGIFFLLVLVSSVMSFLVPGFHPILCLWLALFAVAAHDSRHHAMLALLLACLPVSFNVHETFREPEDAADGPLMVVAVTVFLLLINLATFGVGRWTRWSVTQRALVARLAAAQAEAEERRRIARELHDVVAHSVSLMALQAAGAEHVMATNPDRARCALRQVSDLGEQATEELRRMLGILVPATGSSDQDAGAPARLQDLSRLLTNLRATDREIVFSVTGQSRSIDTETDEAGYRIVQEALTNALKYADPRKPITITVTWTPQYIELDVLTHGRANQKVGAPRFSTSNGVKGMHERAHAVGGKVSAGPTSDGGYRVTARLPVPACFITDKQYQDRTLVSRVPHGRH